MASSGRISSFLQSELGSRGLDEVPAVEAAQWLDREGLLEDAPSRPGKPLRALLRDGQIDGAEQRPPVRHGRWFITRFASNGSPARSTPPVDPARKQVPDVAAERARERYRPDDVRVLLIGESRPAGGTFFYFGNSLLFEATREAFFRAIARGEKDDFLDAFRKAGCFLEDLCREPVNRMGESDRDAARTRSEPDLARRLEGLEPDLVIIVMKAIVGYVERALEEAGLRHVQTYTVPFPRRQWRNRYVDELAGYLADWHAGS